MNSSQWRRDHFTNGIYHSSPSIGTHYELYFSNDKNLKTRVTLFRPQAPPVSVKQDPIRPVEKVNIILPLAGRSSAFKVFLAYFEPLLVKLGSNIFLTMVYFGNSVTDMMSHIQPFIIKHKFRSYHIEHVKETFLEVMLWTLASDGGIRELTHLSFSVMWMLWLMNSS